MDQLTLQNNYNLFCRLCLCSDENLLSIFDEKNVYLPQRIAACVNIEIYISDKMPTKICETCLTIVNNWFDFKKCCDDSQSKLRQWVNVNAFNSKGFGVPIPMLIKEDIFNDTDEIQIDDNVYIKEEPEDYDNEHFSPRSENEESGNFEPPDESFLQVSTYESSESLLVPVFECPAPLHGLYRAPPCNESKEETRQCRLCYKEFSSISNRQRHEKDVHIVNALNKNDSLDLENSVTDDSLTDKSDYLADKNTGLLKPINGKHFIELHKTIKEMVNTSVCILCGEKKINLIRHLSKKIYLESFTCYSCFISYNSRNALMKHYGRKLCEDRARLISDSSVKAYQHYQCLFCKDFFGHVLHMANHLITSHIEETHPTSCTKCEKQYQNYDEYKEHLQTICFYEVYCSICHETFKSEEEFTNHSQIHETEASEFCFDDYVSLSFNCRDKNKEIVNKYSCSQCGDQFPTLELWCEHQTIHCELNQCMHCNRVFGTLEELNEHKSKHNNKIKLKLYRCSSTNSYKTVPDFSQEFKVINVKSIEEKENEEQKFKCNLCPKEYALEIQLKKHIYGHKKKKSDNDYKTKKRKLRCSKCYKSVTHVTLRNHDCPYKQDKPLSHTDVTEEKYKCDYCAKQYSTLSGLTSHLNLYPHHKLKRLSNRTTALDAHKKITNQLVTEYDCEICGKQLKTSPGYKKHVKYCHGEPTTPPPEPAKVKLEKPKTPTSQPIKVKIEPGLNTSHRCNFCDMEYGSKADLNSHVKLHLNGVTVNYLYNCTFCPVACTTQNQLAKHVAKNHSENSKIEVKKETDFECKLCKKFYSQRSSLNKHNSRIHNIKGRKKKAMHKCKQCSKVCPTAETLQQHIDSCYYCNLCKKSFISKVALTSHVVKHPSKTKFHCIKCKAAFYFQKDYIIHLRQHKKTFKCQICTQSFPSMKILLAHSSTVHGKQNIKKKIVKNPVSFKKLKKEVNEVVVKKEIKEFPRAAYRCTECNVTFVNSKQLRLHVLGAHVTNEV